MAAFRIKILISVLFISSFMMPTHSMAKPEGKVIEVPPPTGPASDLLNIQAAIDTANNGDIIQLAEGTYILAGVDPGTDVTISTPGGFFSYRDSVLSWFGFDPHNHIEDGAWLDSRGKTITIQGATGKKGVHKTTITSENLQKTNHLLVHSAPILIKDLRFEDMVSAILAFSPINMDNVDFIDVFFPASAYVDARFVHPNWDPVESPEDFSGTIPVTWNDVRYLGACGQSHISMSGWKIMNSYFHTQQNPSWGKDFFYSDIYTGAFGFLFSYVAELNGSKPVPENVLALSIFRDFEVINSTFISDGTDAGLDITAWASLTIPTRAENISVRNNLFLDTDGLGFGVFNDSDLPIKNVVVKDNKFDNVASPLLFWSRNTKPPIFSITVNGNIFTNWAPSNKNYSSYHGMIYATNTTMLTIEHNDYRQSGIQELVNTKYNPAAAAIWLDTMSSNGFINETDPNSFPLGQSTDIRDYLINQGENNIIK